MKKRAGTALIFGTAIAVSIGWPELGVAILTATVAALVTARLAKFFER